MGRTYDKNNHEIKTKVGEIFSIELESNPTTGYKWEESFDKKKVKLIDKNFDLPSSAFGAAGKEIFTFEALSEGISTIQLDYKRAWESESIEKVEIKLQSDKS
jgi:inhibitor of cysteine peptidase